MSNLTYHRNHQNRNTMMTQGINIFCDDESNSSCCSHTNSYLCTYSATYAKIAIAKQEIIKCWRVLKERETPKIDVLDLTLREHTVADGNRHTINNTEKYDINSTLSRYRKHNTKRAYSTTA